MNFLNKKQQKYKELFKGPTGEFILSSLFDFAGFYKQSFVANDPYQSAFNEGKRAVALHIIQHLEMREEDLRNLVRNYREEMFSSSSIDQGKDLIL